MQRQTGLMTRQISFAENEPANLAARNSVTSEWSAIKDPNRLYVHNMRPSTR